MVRQLSSRPNLSNSYIISGQPEEAGRHCAKVVAQAMVCTSPDKVPCGSCNQCKKVAAGIHPDCTVVTLLPKKHEILAEQVRALRKDTFILPNEGNRKVFIIDQATQMNVSAQNILLKVLEEGPTYVGFLLLASHPDLLLPTIRSRCEVLSLAPYTPSQPSEKACTFAQRLITGSELELMEFVLTLEKMDRTHFATLIQETLSILTHSTITPRTMKAMLLLKEMEEPLALYVGVSTLCTALCANLFLV